MKRHITQKTVLALRPPAAGNLIVYDDEVPGFGVRITSQGVRSFVLNYSIRGRERRFTIGRFPELTATAARAEAIELRGLIRRGEDPLAQREESRLEPTVADLARDYLARHGEPHKRPGSLLRDRLMLKRIILPRLGHLRTTAVSRRDLEALHHSLEATPYHANRVLALISKMFSLAIEWGWRADNPVRGIPKFHEEKKERWLTAGELSRISAALDTYHNQSAADAIRLLILTGAREGEILAARWGQFDLERGIWTKPSHHTKQKRTEHVPLNEKALRVLERMCFTKSSEFLFPGARSKPRVTLRRPWVQVLKSAGLVEALTVTGKRRKLTRYRPTVRIHDLRHTFASQLVSRGESLHIVGRLLGHTQPQTTARYAHVADAALRQAANKFRLISGKAVRA